MDLNKATVPKAVPHLADTQALPPLISLNMVVCLNNQDLNQPDRWLTNSLQASSLVSKADMVDHLPNLLANILTSRWAMEVLPALVVMVAVLSRPPMLNNGVPQLAKPLETASVVTRDEKDAHLTIRRTSIVMFLLCRFGMVSRKYGISIQGSNFLLSAFASCYGVSSHRLGRTAWNLHRVSSFQDTLLD